MADIDYEAEYNNRARVPEHEEIFRRWARDAVIYRDDMLQRDRAELELAYGDAARETLDLFLPEAAENAPLTVFIHGGYWRSLEPSTFSHMAHGLNAHGVAVAMPGYDLCPDVAVADIIEQMRRACAFLWQRRGRSMLVCGWSAGAHLAAAMVATDWHSLYPRGPADLVTIGYGISGVYDLSPLLKTSMNQDLRLDADSVRQVSPLSWPLPTGRTFDAVAGALESSEFTRQSRALAETWQQAGAQTRYEAIAGMNHITELDALADPQSAMTARIAALAQSLSS